MLCKHLEALQKQTNKKQTKYTYIEENVKFKALDFLHIIDIGKSQCHVCKSWL